MKIVKFEEFHVDCGWEIYAFLKVSTDEGMTGWSEFSGHRRPGIDAAIHGMGRMLIGQDPRAINRIDALLYSFTRPVPGGRGPPEQILPEDMLVALVAQLAGLGEGAAPGVATAVEVTYNYKAEVFPATARKAEPFALRGLKRALYEPKALAAIRASTST